MKCNLKWNLNVHSSSLGSQFARLVKHSTSLVYSLSTETVKSLTQNGYFKDSEVLMDIKFNPAQSGNN